jgi:DNA-binding NarL/FixJ family response regulator
MIASDERLIVVGGGVAVEATAHVDLLIIDRSAVPTPGAMLRLVRRYGAIGVVVFALEIAVAEQEELVATGARCCLTADLPRAQVVEMLWRAGHREPFEIPSRRLLPRAGQQRPTLTAREHEVLLLICRGLTNDQIATELTVSFETAKSHVASVLAKLGASSRRDLLSVATTSGSRQAETRAERNACSRRQLGVRSSRSVQRNWLIDAPSHGHRSAWRTT